MSNLRALKNAAMAFVMACLIAMARYQALNTSNTAWENSLKVPDATKISPMLDYNISTQFPKSLFYGQKMPINATTDVTWANDSGANGNFSGAVIRPRAPDSLVQNGAIDQHSSWIVGMCLFQALKVQHQKQSGDRTCKAIISDDYGVPAPREACRGQDFSTSRVKCE